MSGPERGENLAVLEALDEQARALVWLKADLAFDPTAALARLSDLVATGANDPRLRLTALGNRALARLRAPAPDCLACGDTGYVMASPTVMSLAGFLTCTSC